MDDEELWARAYFAALTGLLSGDYEQHPPHVASVRASEYADEFVGDIRDMRAHRAREETSGF
jgi:hypothetical protein